MVTVEELLKRSVKLKHELLEFLRDKRISREFEAALHQRYGSVVTGDENEIAIFFDSFLLGHRLSDGRTPVERFVRARGDLPRADREWLLSWVDPLESVFEAGRLEGETLSAVNLVDELTYAVRSNMGLEGLAQVVPGTIMVLRLVPVLDEWMITGPVVMFPEAEPMLRVAARWAARHPEATCRNPRHREVALEMMRERRAVFVAHFGSDQVVVPGADLRRTLTAYWEAAGDAAARHEIPSDLVEADTVGLIFDADGGLGYYTDFDLLWSAFADPEPSRAALRLVRDYLESPLTSPVPLRRCVEAFPDRADDVFGAALGRKTFSWARDGEALLRRHKPDYQGVPSPGVSVVSDRLRPYLEAGSATDAGSA